MEVLACEWIPLEYLQCLTMTWLNRGMWAVIAHHATIERNFMQLRRTKTPIA